MKKFKKNQKNLFVCEECDKTFKTVKGLSIHIRHSHNGEYKKYYDKWLKSKNDSNCKICGNKTKFQTLIHGYKFCCSKKCSKKYSVIRLKEETFKKYGVKHPSQREYNKEKIKKLNLEKYGVTYQWQREYIKEKIKQTCLERYGVDNPNKNEKVREKIKETCLKRYRDENYNNIKKYKQTCLERYGVDNPNKNEKVREKIKETNLDRYGFEFPVQNIDIFEKSQKTRFLRKQFRNTDLWYQGSYELDFLETYYDKYPDLERGPSIKFLFENKNKVYHSDFYILSLNLIIEIKNSYLYKRDKLIIEAKEKATIDNGFNYLMIIDKNYYIFEELVAALDGVPS